MAPFSLLISVLGTLGALTVLGAAIWLDPDPAGHGTHTQLGLPACSNYPCVSCGLTTSFASMIRGRVGDAFRANPAGILLFLTTLIAPWWFVDSVRTLRDPLRFLHHRWGRWLLPGLVALVIACWIIRRALL